MSIYALNCQYQATLQLTGPGFGAGGVPYMEDTQQTTPPGTACPPPTSFVLTPGLNNIPMPPSPYVFARVMLLPPAGSDNAKGFCTAAGLESVALSGWTGGSVTVPTVPGGTLYISSESSETLVIGYST